MQKYCHDTYGTVKRSLCEGKRIRNVSVTRKVKITVLYQSFFYVVCNDFVCSCFQFLIHILIKLCLFNIPHEHINL